MKPYQFAIYLYALIATGYILSLKFSDSNSATVSISEFDPGERYFYECEIIRVIDGDTVEARIDLGFDTSRIEILRLYGLNAPEVTGIEKAEGLKSEAWIVEKLDSAEVIEIRTIKDKKGSFGRYLAILFVDGENLNQLMIDSGMAEIDER